jgi:hypothetical protein
VGTVEGVEEKEGVGGDEGKFFSTPAGGRGSYNCPATLRISSVVSCCFVPKVVDILSSSTLSWVIDISHDSGLLSFTAETRLSRGDDVNIRSILTS